VEVFFGTQCIFDGFRFGEHQNVDASNVTAKAEENIVLEKKYIRNIKQIAYLWRDGQRDWLGRAFPHSYPATQSCDSRSVGSALEGSAERRFCPSMPTRHQERGT